MKQDSPAGPNNMQMAWVALLSVKFTGSRDGEVVASAGTSSSRQKLCKVGSVSAKLTRSLSGRNNPLAVKSPDLKGRRSSEPKD